MTDDRGWATVVGIFHERVENNLTKELGMPKVFARWNIHDQKRTMLIDDVTWKLGTIWGEADPVDFIEQFQTTDDSWAHHLQHDTKQKEFVAVQASKHPPARPLKMLHPQSRWCHRLMLI